jgi:hypothetical protein
MFAIFVPSGFPLSGLRSSVSSIVINSNSSKPLRINTPPPTSNGTALAYDSLDHYVLLFGGANGTSRAYSNSWKLEGGEWTELRPVSHPSARVDAYLTYDAHDGYVVLFGGCTNASCKTYLDDTWSYAAGVWTRVATSGAPPAMVGGGMVYDSGDGYVVLSGGHNASGGVNGTWSYSGGVWTQLSPRRSPSPAVSSPGLAYDAGDRYVVYFGGCLGNRASCNYTDETWKYAGGQWTQLHPKSAPSARADPALAYDSTNNSVLLFGGNNAKGALFDTWEFHAGNWTKVSTSVSPNAMNPVMAFDERRDDAAVLGFPDKGTCTNCLGGFATFSEGDWTIRPPLGANLALGTATVFVQSGTGRNISNSGCRSGDYCAAVTFAAVANGLNLSDLEFEVTNASGAVVGSVVGYGILNQTGRVAAYEIGPIETVWGPGPSNDSFKVTAGQAIQVDLGSTNPSGLGYTLVAVGTHQFLESVSEPI